MYEGEGLVIHLATLLEETVDDVPTSSKWALLAREQELEEDEDEHIPT